MPRGLPISCASCLLIADAEVVDLEVRDAAPNFEASEDVRQTHAVIDDRSLFGCRGSGLGVLDEVIQIEAEVGDSTCCDVADDRSPFELPRDVGRERASADGEGSAGFALSLTFCENIRRSIELNHEEAA